MAEELLINVNIEGTNETGKLDDNISKLGKTTNKAQTELQKLRNELKDAKNAMLSAQEGTAEYSAALARAAKASFELRDANQKIKASALDAGETAKNFGGAINGLAGGFAAAQGAMALFGLETSETEKVMLKVMSALSVTEGLSNFMDSIQNMKDLYQGLKAAVLASAAAKQVETAASVENTVANTAEAVAITGVGTATKVTSKAIMASLGPYALIAAAIAAVVAGLILLIKKINEVPEDIKIKLEIDKEVEDKLRDSYIKAKMFSNQYYDAVKAGNKDRIKQLEEIGTKEFGLHREQLKMIGKNKEAWREAFKNYIDYARQAYTNEALIKREAEAEIGVENLSRGIKQINTDLPDIEKAVKQLGVSKEDIALAYTGKWYGKPIEGLIPGVKDKDEKLAYDLLNEIYLLNKERKEKFDKLLIEMNNLQNARKLTKELYKNIGGGTITGGTETKKFVQESDPEYLRNLIDESVKNMIKKLNETPKETIDILTPEDTASLVSLFTPGAMPQEDMDEVDKEVKKYVKEKRKEFADDERETLEKIMDEFQSYATSLGTITDSISALYDLRLDKIQQYYDAEAALIENSLMSEDEKNKRLAVLDAERYEKQKVLFEQQKKFREATVYLDLASGLMGIWTRATSPEAAPSPFNWIAAGLESAAIIAQSVTQVASIRAQTLEAPKGLSNTSATPISLSPKQSALTSSEQNNINAIAKAAGVENQIYVKVSEIDEVQNKVRVREKNSFI